MSNVSLLIHVGGTKMTVDLFDHYNSSGWRPGTIGSSAPCLHCGCEVADYEQHLVWHIEVIKDFSLMIEDAGSVMPQDFGGDEVGAPERPPERRLRTCKVCGHIHKDEVCGQPWRGNPNNPCPCDAVPS